MFRRIFTRCHSIFTHEMRDRLSNKFRDAKVLEPDWSAELIIAHVLGEQMYSHLTHDQINSHLSRDHELSITELMQGRLDHTPLQYLLGEWHFRKLNLKMKAPVFIPRPETEALVGFVQDEISNLEHQSVLEIGCGSGAICLSLLKESEKELRVTAIDANKQAVDLTTENSILNEIEAGENFRVFHSDLSSFRPFDSTNPKEPFVSSNHNLDVNSHQIFDGIVSNPPYIPSHQIKDLEADVVRHESHLALDGGKDGLDVVEQILLFAGKHLKSNGWIWLEVDDSHPGYLSENLRSLQEKLFTAEQLERGGFRLERVENDLFDKPRFVKLIKS